MNKIIAVFTLAMLILFSGAALGQEDAPPPPVAPSQPAPVVPPAPPPQPAPPPSEVAPQPADTVEAPAEPAEEPAPAPKPKKEPKPKPEMNAEPAKTPVVQIMLNYWSASLTGELEFQDIDVLGGTTKILGQRVNLEDTLGLENPQSIYEPVIHINLGDKNRITLAWYTADYGGEEELNKAIEFAGYKFAANSIFETTYKIDRYKFFYMGYPLAGEIGRMGLGFGFEYLVWEVGFEGRETSSGIHVEESDVTPLFIPIFGVGGNLNLPAGFGLYAEFQGLGFKYEEFTASYTNLDAGVTFDYKFLHVGVGYRSVNSRLKAEVVEDEEIIDFSTMHQGVTAQIGVNF